MRLVFVEDVFSQSGLWFYCWVRGGREFICGLRRREILDLGELSVLWESIPGLGLFEEFYWDEFLWMRSVGWPVGFFVWRVVV